MKMQELKTNLDWALYYHSIGWSVFPVIAGDKKPLIAWEKYQSEIATEEEIKRWWTKVPNASIGVVTGKISGIVVVDVEAGGDTKDLPPTVIVRTGGGGFHFFYKHPNTPVKNRVRIREKTDIRGDGGYVVAAPSLHKSGNRYEWAVAPEDAGFEDFPRWILEKCAQDESIKTNWNEFLDTDNSQGTRNQQAAALAGKILFHNPVEMWDVVGWTTLKEWNTAKNKPPLPEKELKIVWDSIKKSEMDRRKRRENGNGSTGGRKTKIQSEMLMDIIVGLRDELQFFHNELKEPFVQITIENHKEIWSCKHKMLKRWLGKIFWETYKKSINSENLKATINIVESSACFDGDQFSLNNRTGWYDNAIWYDLADPLWRVVRITPEGWQIINTPPIIFRRYSHQQPQVEPVSGGDVKKLLEYVNIQNDDQEVLLLVWLVSCFIPDFPHPIPNIFGAQGSAKTLLTRLLRKLIDPSLIEAATFPKDIKELVQILAHHSCIFFDNVSYLSNQISDALCKAVTGDGFSKRELFSDEEDIIFSFKRCLGINGINIAARNPDLLERSILFELERVAPENRKQEYVILEEFEKERPRIIGGIFDAVVKAMQIKPSVKLDMLPRMADFVVWGCAIAEALGYTQQQFLDAYYRNIRTQNDEVLQDSSVATAVLQFMNERDEWDGTPSQLFKELKVIAGEQGVDVEKEKGFPRAANVLTRRLNDLKTNLADGGIEFRQGSENKKRMLYLKQTVKNIVETVEPSNEAKNDVDDIFPNF
jgi:hypothetical protein